MSLKSFRLVEEFVQERNASAAVALVHHKGRQYGPVAFGHTAFFPDAPAVTKDTIFDIASLTKVVGTTTITLMLLEDGLFDHVRSSAICWAMYPGIKRPSQWNSF